MPINSNELILAQDVPLENYLPISGGTLTGSAFITIGNNQLRFTGNQIAAGTPTEPLSKGYISFTPTGEIQTGGPNGTKAHITNLASPIYDNEATNKAYVDGKLSYAKNLSGTVTLGGSGSSLVQISKGYATATGYTLYVSVELKVIGNMHSQPHILTIRPPSGWSAHADNLYAIWTITKTTEKIWNEMVKVPTSSTNYLMYGPDGDVGDYIATTVALPIIPK